MKKYLSIILLFVSCYCWGQKKDSCSLKGAEIYNTKSKSFEIYNDKKWVKDTTKTLYSEYIRLKIKGISDSNNKYFKLLNKK